MCINTSEGFFSKTGPKPQKKNKRNKKNDMNDM